MIVKSKIFCQLTILTHTHIHIHTRTHIDHKNLDILLQRPDSLLAMFNGFTLYGNVEVTTPIGGTILAVEDARAS